MGLTVSDRYYGLYRAQVISTNDPLKRKRVTLTIPQILGTAPSGWAEIVGVGSVPKPGATVWATFNGGQVDRPLYFSNVP